MIKRLTSHRRVFEQILPVIVIVILGIFTYQVFFEIPFAGFEIENGRVSLVMSKSPESGSLQVGDRLIKIGTVDFEEFRTNLRRELFENAVGGQSIPIVIARGDQTLMVDWIMPEPTLAQILERLNSQWWIAYIFWVAGTAALLFIRPKDSRWWLFIAFNYLTAVWIGAGSGPSHWHLGQSAIILRTAIWLSVPVYFHFHWLFPHSLKDLPAAFWWLFYLAAGFMVILEWFQILPSNLYYIGALLAFGASILLLFIHFLIRRSERRDILFLLAGVLLAFLPVITISLFQLSSTETPVFAQGGALLALPAIPGAYFFVMFRQQYEELMPRMNRVVRIYVLAVFVAVLFIAVFSILEMQFNLSQSTLILGLISILLAGFIGFLALFPFMTLSALADTSTYTIQQDRSRLRANRLVSIYLFFIFAITISGLLLFILENRFEFRGQTTTLGILTGISIGIIAVVGFEPFQRFVDKRLLGISLPPSELAEIYSSRITTSLDYHNLVHLLRDEIMPSLLIRQSALLRVSQNKTIEVIYASGVNLDRPTGIETGLDLNSISRQPQTTFSPGSLQTEYAWARVMIPLQVDERLIGIWLFGSRDPDDIYAQTEISVLEAIANQTAIALINIEQADRLHALFQADIEQQDAERNRIARGLHDVVLNQLASLSMNANDQNIQKDIHTITNYLREVISDLRPAMLAYGLYLGLMELTDQLNDRHRSTIEFQYLISPSDLRYDEKIEQNLFWIVDQACENAAKHSGGTQVLIKGSLTSQRIHLAVEDDGIGFSQNGELSIPAMLSARRFGLVGMYERADLIGAQLQITSSPGSGTTVSIKLEGNGLIQSSGEAL